MIKYIVTSRFYYDKLHFILHCGFTTSPTLTFQSLCKLPIALPEDLRSALQLRACLRNQLWRALPYQQAGVRRHLVAFEAVREEVKKHGEKKFVDLRYLLVVQTGRSRFWAVLLFFNRIFQRGEIVHLSTVKRILVEIRWYVSSIFMSATLHSKVSCLVPNRCD